MSQQSKTTVYQVAALTTHPLLSQSVLAKNKTSEIQKKVNAGTAAVLINISYRRYLVEEKEKKL